MSLVPDRITIKRRRDEEPIDALYLQGKRHRSDICWRRVKEDDPAKIQDKSVRQTISSSLETISEAKPLDQAVSITINEERQTNSIVSLPSTNDAKRDSDQVEAQKVGRKGLKPPSFHLAKNLRQPPYTLPLSSSGIRKNRKHKQRKLSVFQAEVKPTPCDAGGRSPLETSGDRDTPETKGSKIDAHQVRLHKRPNVGAAEQARRLATQELYGRGLTKEAPDARSFSNRLDQASEELALQLNAVILQELSNPTEKPQGISSPSKLKFQPKPPPSRERRKPTADREAFNPAEIALDSAAESIDHYIYDTYLKSDAQLNSKVPYNAVTPDTSIEPQLQKLGYLIIGEEDEAAWAEPGELPESDIDCDSDDVDENAEDYYGNDYPEDDLSSDDESSRAAYEMGSQNSDWSDEYA